MTKQDIRKEKLSLRKNVTQRDKKDAQIISHLLAQDFYKNAQSIMTYISRSDEVDTIALIEKMLMDKKSLSAPKCVTECDIEARCFKSFDELCSGAYNILEPSGEIAKNIDLIIVPGVAFNENLHRIGYGAGYYDRFLADKSCITVGLFYEAQKSDFFETNTDVALDYIITEERVYKKE